MPNMSLIRIQFLKVHILLSRYYGFVKMQTASTTEYYFRTIGYLKIAYYELANKITCSFFLRSTKDKMPGKKNKEFSDSF